MGQSHRPVGAPSHLSRLSRRITSYCERVMSMAGPPSVFISYAWSDVAERSWVQQLAERLQADGVNVWLDRWLLRPGAHLPGFMESAIREADFVLIICTPSYKVASDARSGGVGYEGDVITGEILARQEAGKFIPILRAGEWVDAAPSWALGRWYVDFRGSPYSESMYHLLISAVFGRFAGASPISGKSALSPIWPRWSEAVNPVDAASTLTPRRVIAHFLDHYILELSGYGRGNIWLDRSIAKEVGIALRIAILAADEVLIPAVSYFQSPLCRRLVNKFRNVFDLGVIRLMGDAYRWDEFRDNRLKEYSSESAQHDIYSNLNGYRGVLPPLDGTSRNTTLALHRAWDQLVVPRGVELLSPVSTAGDRVHFVGDPERIIERMPEFLGTAAFVAENVYPRIFDNFHGSLLGNLSLLICRLFFGVLTEDFPAGYVDNLVYVRNATPSNAEFVLPYRAIVRRMHFNEDLYNELCVCPPMDLLRLQRDPRVVRIIHAAPEFPPADS